MRLVIIGAPNSGKGTQSKKIAEKFKLSYISTGGFFRDHFRFNTTFNDYTRDEFNSGLLCSDNTMNEFIRILFEQGIIPNDNYLIDSYPRTISQAQYFDKLVQGQFSAIYLRIQKEVSIERALARYSQERRDDDLDNIPERRWEIFKSQTLPLIKIYRGEDLLIEQDGVGDIEFINRQLEEKIRVYYNI